MMEQNRGIDRSFLIRLAFVLLPFSLYACTKNKEASTHNASTELQNSGLASSNKEKPSQEKQSQAPSSNKASKERTVHLFTWANYTSPELLKSFTKKTGITVIESNYASNEELLAKLQAGAKGFDIALPSDYMVSVMGKLNLLEPLDKALIPNISGIDPTFLKKAFDPENRFSLPYAWAVTGIAVNVDAYPDPVKSWSDLFQNPKASGRISILDDVRETIGAALRLHHASINSKDPLELKKAKETLIAAKKHIKMFNTSPLEAISSGEVWLAQMYSQEAILAARSSKRKINFIIPKEGSTLGLDNLVILRSSTHKAEAYALIDFLLEVQSNVDFVTRVAGGPIRKDTKALLPSELRNLPALFPSPELLEQCEMIQDLGEITAQYDRLWAEIKIAH